MFGFNKHGGRGRHQRCGGTMQAAGSFEDGPFARGFGGGRDGFGGGRGGGFGGGRGGMRRGKRFEGEELRLMVLGLLSEQAQHGYQLIRGFAEKSGGAYQPSPGVLYPMLAMLEDMGLVVAAASESSRRSYTLTEGGQAEVIARKAELDALLARLAAMAEEAGRTDSAPVRRAVHNMRAAVMERLARVGADDQLGFEVARIIDEATQQIERL